MNVGLLGHGIVGSGVAEILLAGTGAVGAQANTEVQLKRILDLREFDLSYRHLFVKDAGEIVRADDIDLVAECMGGVEPAYSFLKAALQNRKHCVTSNKQLVVEKGAELTRLAEEYGVHFLYEASCGGGIPLLHPIRFCLGANRVQSVTGILNGTTNYLLTRMAAENMGYEAALQAAQESGFAERDPTADVEGHDTRRKLAILAHLAFGADFADEALYPCVGISQVTNHDLQFAKHLQCSIRLLGHAVRTGEGYTAEIRPCLLPLSHPLSNVQGVNNAVLLGADLLNEVMFYGPGAGKLPTASAIVSDIIEAASMPVRPRRQSDALPYVGDDSCPGRYFVRFVCDTAHTVRNSVETLHHSKCIALEGVANQSALLTPELTFQELDETLRQLDSRGVLLGQVLRYIAPVAGKER